MSKTPHEANPSTKEAVFVRFTPDVIRNFKPVRAFTSEGCASAGSQVISGDFDDWGGFYMTASTDDCIRLYNCATGEHSSRSLFLKYGLGKVRFTHATERALHTSTTKGNENTVRLFSVEDSHARTQSHKQQYIDYFSAHEGRVTALEMSPTKETFLTGAKNDGVRLWDFRRVNDPVGLIKVQGSPCIGCEPGGMVFALAIPERNALMLYDIRQFDKLPFLTLLIKERIPRITSLLFSNDGRHLLVGTAGDTHYVHDAFDGQLLFRLRGHKGLDNPADAGARVGMTSGEELCWSPDAKFVFTGSANQMIIAWEIPNKTSEEINQPMELDPCWETSTSATVAAVPAVVQFNPRRALLCASGKYTTMWLPPKPTDDSSD